MLILNDKNFGKEILESQKPALVDFYASWCPPCRMLSPILEKLSKEYADKVIFAKLNVDLNPITSQKHGITNLPTVALFKNGKPVSGFVGARTEKEIKDWFEENLGGEEEEEEGVVEARENVDKLIGEYEKYAENQRIKLNPNKEVVKAIIKGLIQREQKFGFCYCPCRRVSGNKDDDKKIICPCFYHREEIERVGHCFCNLFVKKT